MLEQRVKNLLDNYVNVPHHFAHANGITVTHIDSQCSRGELVVGDTSCNPGGKVHGGALLTLADTVSGCYVVANSDSSCVTSNTSMEFLRPADGPLITCVATPKKMGRAISVMAVTLTDARDKVVATGTYTFYMVPESEKVRL